MPGGDDCEDKDFNAQTNEQLTDSTGDPCYMYFDKESCARFDDDDFKSNKLCCLCGGGSNRGEGGEDEGEEDEGDIDDEGDGEGEGKDAAPNKCRSSDDG